METLIRLDRVPIKDYYYMTIMDENVNWMQHTYQILIFFLNHKALFRKSAFTSENCIAILVEHMIQIIPLPYASYVHFCLKFYPFLHSN